MFVECEASECSAGAGCRNQRLQRQIYPKCKVKRAGKERGKGRRRWLWRRRGWIMMRIKTWDDDGEEGRRGGRFTLLPACVGVKKGTLIQVRRKKKLRGEDQDEAIVGAKDDNGKDEDEDVDERRNALTGRGGPEAGGRRMRKAGGVGGGRKHV
eukprot:750601-Hanusia_phi.AAC.1